MRHNIWPFAALVIVVGCAADPVSDEVAPPPDENEEAEDIPRGCKIGVIQGLHVDRLAEGGTLDVKIKNDGWFAEPRLVTSSAPGIMTVAQTDGGATLRGVAPGTASIEVWRCDRKIASFPVTVVKVAEIEARLDLGVAGRSDPLTTLVALVPGAPDRLELRYYDDQHAPLEGRGVGRFTYEGGVRPAGPSQTSGDCGGPSCDHVSIEIDAPGRLIATAGEVELALDVTTTPAPARVELVLRHEEGFAIQALEVLGETATGQPIAGLAAEVTAIPEQYTPVPFSPTSLLLLAQPGATATFTATVAGVTGTLTATFP